jgi:type I restriction enzyme S subunit
MKWNSYQLRDIANYWTGKVGASALDASNYISTDNLIPDKGGIVNSSYVPKSGNANSYAEKDVLISNIRPYFKKIWFADKEGGCSNDVLVFRAKENIEPLFLYYQLSKDAFFDDMVAGSNGTKMPRGNKTSIMEFKLQIPPLPTQRKIASILSAYDDLIGNNLKRIKLLEEKALLRYKGIVRNEKLESVKLKDVAVVNQSSLKSNSDIEKLLYVDIASVSTGSIDNKTEYELKEAPGRAKRILKHHDIIWSCVRPNRKSYSFVWRPEENLIGSTGFAVISAKTIPATFLYQLITTNDFVSYLENHAKGATYPAVTASDFEDATLLICSKNIMDEYHEEVNQLFELKYVLQKQNSKLREARDILLPKLMNGQIEV